MVRAFGYLDNLPSYRGLTEKQTVAYNLRVREEFKRTVRARMSIWEAMEKLSELVDDSDPDVSIFRLLQAFCSCRRRRLSFRFPSRHLRRIGDIDI